MYKINIYDDYEYDSKSPILIYSLRNDLKNHTNRPKRPSKEITISNRLISSLVIQHQRRPYKFSIRFIRRLDKETNQIITYNSVTNTQIPWIVQKEKNLRKECKIETNCIFFPVIMKLFVQ